MLSERLDRNSVHTLSKNLWQRLEISKLHCTLQKELFHKKYGIFTSLFGAQMGHQILDWKPDFLVFLSILIFSCPGLTLMK